jgi:hypothetical protein
VNALPQDPASEPEPMVNGLNEFEGFDAELAAALEELGRQVRPHEFDAHTIQRRTARRRSSQVLAASVAGIAVVAGASAFAARAGTPAAPPAQTPTSSSQAVAGTDPLVAPGYFRTAPNGGAANGFTQFGGTTLLQNTFDTSSEQRMVLTDWTVDGDELSAQVNWYGKTPQTTPPTGKSETPDGTVNGRTAYYSAPNHEVTFWTGSQGYATVSIVPSGTTENSRPDNTSDDLLSAARSLVPTPAKVPMPIRISGLDSATVASADMGWASPAQPQPWYTFLVLLIDGKEYNISAAPGPAVTPPPAGTFAIGQVSAEKTVDGVGIVVTTWSGKSGSPSAPTAAQVLADVTSLGMSPSGWTTNVMVK